MPERIETVKSFVELYNDMRFHVVLCGNASHREECQAWIDRSQAWIELLKQDPNNNQLLDQLV